MAILNATKMSESFFWAQGPDLNLEFRRPQRFEAKLRKPGSCFAGSCWTLLDPVGPCGIFDVENALYL